MSPFSNGMTGGMGGMSNAFSGMGGMGGMSSAFSGMRGMGGMGGTSAFGGGFGGMGGGMGGFGQSGFGGSAFGGSAFGGNQGFGGGMYGGNMGGQNFVGRDSGDMNSVMSQMGRAGTQFFNNMNRNMSSGRNNRNRQQPEETSENTPPTVRIRLEVGFPQAPVAPSQLATSLRSRLTRLAVDHNLGRPQVVVEGDTVVLRGVAESESQSAVLAQLIAMEPGVRAVRNEMTVAGAP
jgi:hypothetical protein